jgi:hypothetical protein
MLTSSFSRAYRLLRKRLEDRNIIDISDAYTLRLQQINTGMLHRGNLYCFRYALERLPSSAPIVEIGSFCGLSTNIITYYKEVLSSKNKLINCDPWDYGFKGLDHAPIGSSSITGNEWGEFAKVTFEHNVKFISR